jgi:hypothetical protein
MPALISVFRRDNGASPNRVTQVAYMVVNTAYVSLPSLVAACGDEWL